MQVGHIPCSLSLLYPIVWGSGKHCFVGMGDFSFIYTKSVHWVWDACFDIILYRWFKLSKLSCFSMAQIVEHTFNNVILWVQTPLGVYIVHISLEKGWLGICVCLSECLHFHTSDEMRRTIYLSLNLSRCLLNICTFCCCFFRLHLGFWSTFPPMCSMSFFWCGMSTK